MRAKHPERAKRLRDFLNRLKINNITLASKLGIKPAFISQLLNKHSTVTANMALRIAHVYPTLNINWLLDGTGEMLIEKKEEVGGRLGVVMEPDVGYERRAGEGRLEWLERKVEEAKTTQQDLLQMLAEAREQYIKLEEEHTALVQQLGEIKKRLSDLEGEK